MPVAKKLQGSGPRMCSLNDRHTPWMQPRGIHGRRSGRVTDEARTGVSGDWCRSPSVRLGWSAPSPDTYRETE